MKCVVWHIHCIHVWFEADQCLMRVNSHLSGKGEDTGWLSIRLSWGESCREAGEWDKNQPGKKKKKKRKGKIHLHWIIQIFNCSGGSKSCLACAPQAITTRNTRQTTTRYLSSIFTKKNNKYLVSKTYLHQDARPLRGGEGNFVHKMRDVPGREKNREDVRPKITAVGGQVIHQLAPRRWARVTSSSKT